MKMIRIDDSGNSEPASEMLALCIIIKTGNFDNFRMEQFTGTRRYVWRLLAECFAVYKSIDENLVKILHYSKQVDLIAEVNATFDTAELIGVPYSDIEELFKAALVMEFKDEVIGTIGAQLVDLEKRRIYVKTVAAMLKRANEGNYSPMDDVLELEQFNNSANFKALDTIETYNVYKTQDPAVPIKTGIKQMDNKACILKSNVIVLGGDTASLKTTSALWLILQILKNNPTYTAIFFEKEMPIADIINKIMSWVLQRDIADILYDNESCIKQMDDVLAGNHKHSAVIIDLLKRLKLVSPNQFDSIEDILNYVQSEKADIWCLDFLTQMFQEAKNAAEFSFKVMGGINKIKGLTHKTGSTAIIICQLNKGTIENRILKIPQLDDIEWSSNIKKVANCVFMTFYPQLYMKNQFINDKEQCSRYFYLVNKKNRFAENFSVALTASPATNTFMEPREIGAQMHWLNSHISKIQKL